MKKFKGSFHFILILVLIVYSYSNASNNFVIVENLSPEYIQSNNLHVIFQLRQSYFSILSDDKVKFLTRDNCTYTIVDKDPLSKIYFLVYHNSEKRSNIELYSRILKSFGDCYLVEIKKDDIDNLLNLQKPEFIRLTFDPIHIGTKTDKRNRRYLKNILDNLTYKPSINEIVNKVSTDSIINSIQWLQNVGTRHCEFSDMGEKVVPWVMDKFKNYGCDTVYLVEVTGYNAPNVIGVKLGTKYPSYSNYAAIGGHIDAMPKDSISNKGADDNAAGFSCVLEAARIFKDYKFEHTIYYIAWNCEEVGILGSKVHAEHIKSIGDTVIGIINSEMPGHVPPGEIGYISVTPHKYLPLTEDLANIFIKMGETYTTQKFHYDTSQNMSSDHARYWVEGITAIKLREKVLCSDVYHTNADTLWAPNGLNSPEQVKRSAQTSVATLCEIAKLEEFSTNTTKYKTDFKNDISISKLRKKIILNLNLPEKANFSVTLFNMNGRKIFHKGLYTYNMKNVTLLDDKDYNKLVNGVYIIEVQLQNIIKQKVVQILHINK